MATLEIKGAVDWVASPDTLVGWAKIEGQEPGQEPVVEAMLRGVVVGRGRANLLYGSNKEATRFIIPLTIPLNAVDLLTGTLAVVGSVPGTENSTTLSIYPGLFDQLVGLHYANRLACDGNREVLGLLRSLCDKAHTGIMKRLKDCLPYVEQEDDAKQNIADRDVTPLTFLKGARSSSVVVGGDGYLFLEGGSNGLMQQYKVSLNESHIAQAASAWHNLIRRRAASIAALGAEFVQVIIPEKNTALAELLPYPLTIPTAVYRAVRSSISADLQTESIFFDALACIRAAPTPAATYRKLDTHLTSYGSCRVFEGVLAHLGHPMALDFEFTVRRTAVGDLSEQFIAAEMAEYVYSSSDSRILALEAGLISVERFVPPEGKHVGARCIWRNEAAPIKKKIVVFGNSFFELGGHPMALSWWFARWFKEFHFLWRADLDEDYVKMITPDVVMCQTIERFLPTQPAA